MFPDLSSDVVSLLEKAEAGTRAASAQTLVYPLEPSFIDPVRQELLILHRQAGTATQLGCPMEAGDFSPQLQTAIESLDYLDYETAKAALIRAQNLFECTHEAIGRERLEKFWLASALLRFHANPEDLRGFDGLLSVTPDLSLADNYPQPVVDAFALARKQAELRSRKRVQVMSGDLAGLSLWLDGEPVTSGSRTVLPGKHLLQLVSSEGWALAGTLLDLEVIRTFPTTYLPPEELRLPSTAAALDDLRSEVLDGLPGPLLKRATQALFRSGRYAWVQVIVPARGQNWAQMLTLRSDGSFLRRRIESERLTQLDETESSQNARHRRPGLIAGLAACVVGGSAYYGYAYQVLGDPEHIFPNERTRDQFRVGAQVAGTAALTCLAGVALTAGREWLSLRRAHRDVNSSLFVP